jgi:nucleoid-associated protein YgaU
MALMGAAFVGLTIVLIVFQPGSPRNAATSISLEPSVTRTASALEEVVSASATDARPEPRAVAATPVAAASDRGVAGPEQPASMRDLTFGAISNLKTATTGATPAPGQPGSLLYSVVKRSMGLAEAPDARPVATTPYVVASPPAPSGPRPDAAAVSYFVKPGDTLVSIARTLYGDVNMASAIFQKNTDVMTRPDSLRAGMVLALPPQ